MMIPHIDDWRKDWSDYFCEKYKLKNPDKFLISLKKFEEKNKKERESVVEFIEITEGMTPDAKKELIEFLTNVK